jgi:hypothetical protein
MYKCWCAGSHWHGTTRGEHVCMSDGQVYTLDCVWLQFRGEVKQSPVFIGRVLFCQQC